MCTLFPAPISFVPILERGASLRLRLDESGHKIKAVPIRLQVDVLHTLPRTAAPPIALRQRAEQTVLGRNAHNPHLAWRSHRRQRHQLVPAHMSQTSAKRM